MKLQGSENITYLEIVKLLVGQHKEVICQITAPHIIQRIMDHLEYEAEAAPLLFDPISHRYFLRWFDAYDESSGAEVLRGFINFGEGYHYILDEAFFNVLEEALEGIEPEEINRPVGHFVFDDGSEI